MEKRKFIIGSILGLAIMFVLSAISEVMGLDVFLVMLFALMALPFVFSAFLVAIGTRPSEATIFTIITQIVAIITIVLTVLDGIVKLELYVGTLALGFISVILLHMERTIMRRRIARHKRISETAMKTEIKRDAEKKIVLVPEVPKEQKKSTGKFVASKNAVENKVHRSTCRIVKSVKPKNKIRFETYSEALQKGYVPCKICLQNEK